MSWSSFAEGASGAGEIRYAVKERTPEITRLTRTRDAYAEVRGMFPAAADGVVDHHLEHFYELTTSARGLVLAIRGTESLEAENRIRRSVALE